MGLNFGNLASGIGGAIPGVGSALGAVTGIISGLGGGRTEDELQLADNAKAYAAAMAGQPAGAEWLKGRGGLGDTYLSSAIQLNATTPFAAGFHVGPWTNPAPRADAASKYGSIVAAAAKGSGGAAAALGPLGAAKEDTPAGQASNALTGTVAGVPTWALLLGAGGVGYLLLRRR